MKKLLFLLALTGMFSVNLMAVDEVFNVTMSLIAPIVITETQALSFPDTVVGTTQSVTVAPADATSARFSLSGNANDNISLSVADTTITDGTTTIDINTYVITDDVGSAITTLDASGARLVRIGANADVDAADAQASYTGTATLTVVYN